jgi:N-acylneuraminate cytidylyltransferase
VIEEVLDKLDDEFDLVCCVYPTSVFVTSEAIEDAISMMAKNPHSTSVATVLEYSHPIQRALEIRNDSLESLYPENYNKRSQDLEKTYHDAGQFYLFKIDSVKAERKLITSSCLPYIIHPNKAHDIDTQEDWDLAELKFKNIELKG